MRLVVKLVGGLLLAGALFHGGMFYKAVQCNHEWSIYGSIIINKTFGLEYVVCR